MAVKEVEIHPHIPIFDHILGKGLHTGKHWATFVSLVDTLEKRVERSEFDPLLVQEIEGDYMVWKPLELKKAMKDTLVFGRSRKLSWWTIFSPWGGVARSP